MIIEKPKSIKYILDTNVLIGFSTWLPIDSCPKFWSFLEDALKKSEWILLDIVVDECKHGQIKTWCNKQNKAGLVTKLEDRDRLGAIEINNKYRMINQDTFKSEGDTYILAYAKNNNLGIFSQESPRRTENDLYKIPDVCSILKIERVKSVSVFLKSMGYRD